MLLPLLVVILSCPVQSWHRKAFGSAGGMTSVKAKGGQTFTDSFDNKMQEQPAKYLHKDSEQHNLPGALQGTLAHLTKHGNFCVNLVCVLLLLTAHDKREAASDCTEEQANLKRYQESCKSPWEAKCLELHISPGCSQTPVRGRKAPGVYG